MENSWIVYKWEVKGNSRGLFQGSSPVFVFAEWRIIRVAKYSNPEPPSKKKCMFRVLLPQQPTWWNCACKLPST